MRGRFEPNADGVTPKRLPAGVRSIYRRAGVGRIFVWHVAQDVLSKSASSAGRGESLPQSRCALSVAEFSSLFLCKARRDVHGRFGRRGKCNRSFARERARVSFISQLTYRA